MKLGNVIPCVCAGEKPDLIADGYAGMPVLRVYGGTDRWYDAKCPVCGRGGLIQHKSAYLALRDWNKMQKELRKGAIFT